MPSNKMLLMVTGVSSFIKNNGNNKYLGEWTTPHRRVLKETILPWAADNAAYSNWDEKKYLKMLYKIEKHQHKPIFVTCPDIVGNAIETAKLFNCWQPLLKEMNLPIALVLQDGQERIGLPCKWEDIQAVFIGGSTDFKLGQWVRYFIGKAKEQKKWIHMGRVNSFKRIAYAKKIGCDSIDGTAVSMFPDTYIPRFLRFIEKTQYQLF